MLLQHVHNKFLYDSNFLLGCFSIFLLEESRKQFGNSIITSATEGIIFSGTLLANHHLRTLAKPPSKVCKTLGKSKKKISQPKRCKSSAREMLSIYEISRNAKGC